MWTFIMAYRSVNFKLTLESHLTIYGKNNIKIIHALWSVTPFLDLSDGKIHAVKQEDKFF